MLTGFFLREAGGWGNIRPPRDLGWIEFLNNMKYCHPLFFWTASLGIDLLLLALLTRLPENIVSSGSALFASGQTPLSSYLAHFYFLMNCTFAFFRAAASLELAYVVWAAILVVLYPVCLRYRVFKMTPAWDSFWPLF